ncbi:hypothetical protein [Criblamydia sequanensis]|uniref:Conserved putative membrane protein n=1 Tax=Candidatus Criblamydia sequanensis CRIB-18 TaxID=1437425 RepID=A0A090D1V2_9BACT|nr:hypothetical protein [Criblamydia sequanensis]CDR33783.1 Conserved putative membrane protein [Criblamydia sequanensis CRIB-18]
MDKFLRELESQDIHTRDRWQFELKSDIEPKSTSSTYHTLQEFYIFIPDALQINPNTYPQEQFYADQTNFIRYKTPVFTFDELNNKNYTASPFYILEKIHKNEEVSKLELELKLLANIYRSTLREQALNCYRGLDKPSLLKKKANETLFELLGNVHKFNQCFDELKQTFEKEPVFKSLTLTFDYIEEFIYDTTEFYLAGLLQKLEQINDPEFIPIRSELQLCIIKAVKKISHFFNKEINETKRSLSPEEKSEYILYRKSLLNKFVLDALLLSTFRFSPQRFQHLIGGFAAGIAMLFFFVLFVWQGKIFGINTMEFILTTVVLYILKDRIKEIIKGISYKMTVFFLADYSTKINSKEGAKIGNIKESFKYLNLHELPDEIKKLRNQDFHDILSNFQRPERVILYRNSIKINSFQEIFSKPIGLNNIFRLNINEFIEKAGDPEQVYWTVNDKNQKLEKIIFPKVYHINIVLRRLSKKDNKQSVDIKKYRLVVTKDGIKRIESLNPYLRGDSLTP